MLKLSPPVFPKAIFIIVLFSTFLCLFSCNNSDDPEGDINPTVSIISPVPNETVNGTKIIQIQASDDKAIKQVELLVNNVSLTTLINTPFNYEWNTATLNDGVYTLKAIATDEDGNHGTAEVSVTINNKNVLVTFDIPNNLFGSNADDPTKGWVILHDKDWEVITWGELKNGETLELIAPSNFKEEKFTLTTIMILKDEGSPYMSASSMMQVPKGMQYSSEEATDNNDEGSANLSFTNIGDNTYTVSTNGGLYSYDSKLNVYSSTGPTDMYFAKSPSKLYIRQNNETDNKFVLTNAFINKEGIYTQDLNEVNNAGSSNILDTETFDVPLGYDFFYVSLYGLPSSGNFKEAYNLGMFQEIDDVVTLEYPKAATNTFAQYFSETQYSTAEYDVYNSSFGKYNFTPLSVEGSFQDFESTSASVTTSGEFDMFSVVFYTENDIINDQFTISGPAVTDQKIEFPAIPTAIIEQLPFADFTAYKLGPALYFIDINSVSNYSDLLLKLSQSGIDDMEQRNLHMYFDLSSGRKKSRETTPRVHKPRKSSGWQIKIE